MLSICEYVVIAPERKVRRVGGEDDLARNLRTHSFREDSSP
jgi:hypothetical protein